MMQALNLKESDKVLEIGTGSGYAAVPYIPNELIKQLKAKGRLIIPIGEKKGIQQLKFILKQKNEKIKEENFEYVRFVPLLGKDSWK